MLWMEKIFSLRIAARREDRGHAEGADRRRDGVGESSAVAEDAVGGHRAEDGDGEHGGPVGRRSVLGGAELPAQRDDEEDDADDAGHATCCSPRKSDVELPDAGGEELDGPEQQADLGDLRGEGQALVGLIVRSAEAPRKDPPGRLTGT